VKDSFLELIKMDLKELLSVANQIREEKKGDIVFTCSIINAKSGQCSENCAFCAQSKYHKTNIKVYPLLSKEEIIRKASFMKRSGATRFSIVTSGKMPSRREIEKISETIREIKEKVGISVCASLGILDKDMAKMLKDSGLDRYHHNLETSKSFFSNICTTHSYEEDLKTLEIAKEVGLKVCSGGIIGLGEGWEQRIELALTLKELNVDSIPINFLIPIPGTRLENMPLLSSSDALKAIAILRIINPEKDITICGGREKILRDEQNKIFFAGANGVMIGDYLTTKGRKIEDDLKMINELGMRIEDEEGRA